MDEVLPVLRIGSNVAFQGLSGVIALDSEGVQDFVPCWVSHILLIASRERKWKSRQKLAGLPRPGPDEPVRNRHVALALGRVMVDMVDRGCRVGLTASPFQSQEVLPSRSGLSGPVCTGQTPYSCPKLPGTQATMHRRGFLWPFESGYSIVVHPKAYPALEALYASWTVVAEECSPRYLSSVIADIRRAPLQCLLALE